MSAKSQKFDFKLFFVALAIVFAIFLICLFITTLKATDKYDEYITYYSKKFNLEISLVTAIIKAESNFDEKAVSNKKAYGLMQLTMPTFEYICDIEGVKPVKSIFDPETNIFAGCAYLSYLKNKFNDETIAITAYNAGEGRVFEWIKDNDGFFELSIVPFPETVGYVKKVEFYRNYYRRIYGEK